MSDKKNLLLSWKYIHACIHVRRQSVRLIPPILAPKINLQLASVKMMGINGVFSRCFLPCLKFNVFSSLRMVATQN